MTDYDDLHRRKEEFIRRFQSLVREACLQLPDEDKEILRAMLQDETSVYHPGIFFGGSES
jgi:hypothetical protein